MSLLGIIPARGGSKGLPRKNIRNFAGKPLIAWTIEQALNVKQIDRLVCSTDDPEIAEVARSYGCDIPFMRPRELSQDDSKGDDVLLHTISHFEQLGNVFDTVICLQCTSPLRTSYDITQAIEAYVKYSAKSLVSVCEVDHPVHWMFRLTLENKLEQVLKGNFTSRRRQDLSKVYRPNGAIFINDIKTIKKTKSSYKPTPFAFIMDKLRSVDIDDEFDFKLAEFIFREDIVKEREL